MKSEVAESEGRSLVDEFSRGYFPRDQPSVGFERGARRRGLDLRTAAGKRATAEKAIHPLPENALQDGWIEIGDDLRVEVRRDLRGIKKQFQVDVSRRADNLQPRNEKPLAIVGQAAR